MGGFEEFAIGQALRALLSNSRAMISSALSVALH